MTGAVRVGNTFDNTRFKEMDDLSSVKAKGVTQAYALAPKGKPCNKKRVPSTPLCIDEERKVDTKLTIHASMK